MTYEDTRKIWPLQEAGVLEVMQIEQDAALMRDALLELDPFIWAYDVPCWEHEVKPGMFLNWNFLAAVGLTVLSALVVYVAAYFGISVIIESFRR